MESPEIGMKKSHPSAPQRGLAVHSTSRPGGYRQYGMIMTIHLYSFENWKFTPQSVTLQSSKITNSYHQTDPLLLHTRKRIQAQVDPLGGCIQAATGIS
jgi:hypothetical protein